MQKNKTWTIIFVYVSEASPNAQYTKRVNAHAWSVNYLLQFSYISLKFGEFRKQESKVDVHPICPY
ncbi:hypothetical protein L6475_14275 [Prevotella sp. E9-3]|uniref:hypothetical protein n=1 Tax=Prevotella sp. E9-3 TaxID=2913621 RepID=UPI001EDA373D|nr:hypothetical protein [Prevotella sp. E9-3]UKK48344.1 hypothetical protein L6475_14275 [Prevotella sp. E9-3]